MKTFVNLWQYPAEFLLKWQIFQTIVAEEIKKHFMFGMIFSKIVPFYEIMQENMADPDRPQMTIKYNSCAWHAG